MEKSLLAWILEWRWECKSKGYMKSKWRKIITQHFMETPEYVIGLWSSDDFCQTWNENENQILYKGSK